MKSMLSLVRKTIENRELLKPKDNVLVALSGGIDSIVLLHALNELKDEYDIEIYAAHLNHQLRDIDSEMDADFAVEFADKLGIMCFVKSIDVNKYSKENSLTIEEAGRYLRYDFFSEVASKIFANKIALAHHKDDQAETVLMRLIRGTGAGGLGAMSYKRDNIIRPLLDVRKDDIIEYSNENNLEYREDRTNKEDIYYRNKIRLDLIPYLKENYNPQIVDSLVKTSNILKEDEEYLNNLSSKIFSEIKKEVSINSIQIKLNEINKLKKPIKIRILKMVSKKLLNKKDIWSYINLNDIINLCNNKETGKSLDLPLNVTARISYDYIVFERNLETPENFKRELFLKEENYIHNIGTTFILDIIKKESINSISKNKYEKYFDYDKVKGSLFVRNRREGDSFSPLGIKGTKKLKDYFIDYKVDRLKRDLIPIITDEEEIIWVVGYRISEKYKVTEHTKNILIIKSKKSL